VVRFREVIGCIEWGLYDPGLCPGSCMFSEGPAFLSELSVFATPLYQWRRRSGRSCIEGFACLNYVSHSLPVERKKREVVGAGNLEIQKKNEKKVAKLEDVSTVEIRNSGRKNVYKTKSPRC
jgi:hypothetical protein